MKKKNPWPQTLEKSDLPFSARISFRVRYAETDAMGVVHHSRYFPWMELGRTELLRELGSSYREWENKGFFLPVIEASCRYQAPARYDDLIIVETQIHQIRAPYISFSYTIQREDGTLLATGITKHVCTNKKGAVIREPIYLLADTLQKIKS